MTKMSYRFVFLGLFMMTAGPLSVVYSSEQIENNFPKSVEDFLRIKNEESPSKISYEGIALPQEGVLRDVIIDFCAVECMCRSSSVYLDTFIHELGRDLKMLERSSNFQIRELIETISLARRLIVAASIVRGLHDDLRSVVASDLHSLNPIIEQVLAQIKSSKD